MSECSVDFPRESDSQPSRQEPDLGSDDRRRDCGDRQLEGGHPLAGNDVRHALDSRWRPGRCLYLNRRRPMGCPVIDPSDSATRQIRAFGAAPFAGTPQAKGQWPPALRRRVDPKALTAVTTKAMHPAAQANMAAFMATSLLAIGSSLARR